ncbi:CYTH and CHAD domain-containing protein [Ottowia testudinis]|uniref:CHAD domain-containing protein n=1 Tax=Ottowia testudinis TaxID=2816950 RepID=A0A975CHX1_9BURK|nr:CYTH and CHAD domain-containing protein [Ottowia testudinis]QTD46495.1 CHAD domain-containing protein [Ottowia testudinis]
MSSAEIELKLALPGVDPKTIAAQLTALPALAGLAPTEQRLKNIYFDTPDQHLRRAQAVLRLRSLRQAGGRARWIQTFKTAGGTDGALSQRGEWEATVRSGQLDPIALQGTPWPGIDTDGQLFAQLAPCFETETVRTLRLFTAEDGSLIEVALDLGGVRAGGEHTALYELELELLKGRPDALFELADHIAARLPVLPSPVSKAERGWRLLDGTARAPRRARKLDLAAELPVLHAAQAVLGEMLGQFVENLGGILHFDNPELVHQARVGWRRWRSALWLFKPLLAEYRPPDTAPLRPLLNALGAVRDFDVAGLESLPQWADAYIAGDPERATDWQTMEAAVQAERGLRRTRLLGALQSPATGQALLQLERWLHALPQAAWTAELAAQNIDGWAAARTKRLHQRLATEVKEMQDADLQTEEGIEHQHNVRLLAKRTRYVLEALRAVLPRERTRRWQDQATELQTSIGAARDLMLLATLLAPLGVHAGILGFLRGVAAGRLAGD